jgi:hypothetical protein
MHGVLERALVDLQLLEGVVVLLGPDIEAVELILERLDVLAELPYVLDVFDRDAE